MEHLVTFGGPIEFFFTELQNDIEIVKEIKTKKHTKKVNEETLENSRKEKYDEEEKIRNAEELKKLEEYFAWTSYENIVELPCKSVTTSTSNKKVKLW